MTMTASQDRRYLRANQPTERFVVLSLQAPTVTTGTRRPPVHLAFVIDRSGSMSGPKMRHARDAVLAGIARLEERDRFAVIAYDDRVDVLAAASDATASAKASASKQVGFLEPRGSTNLEGGWSRAVTEIAGSDANDAVTRVLLLTDGLANIGTADPRVLAGMATNARARGISTSTFGVGDDFDEGLLARMADGGGGTLRYIDEPEKISAYLDDELGEALQVAAREVLLEIAAPSDLEIDVVGPYPVTREAGHARIALPDLVSGQHLEVVVRLRFGPRNLGEGAAVRFELRDRQSAFGNPAVSTDWSVVDATNDTGRARDVDVDRLVAERFSARARERAALQNRDGDFRGATRGLRRTAERIARYASGDPVLEALVAMLMQEAQEMRMPMEEKTRKAKFFTATSEARGRDAQGGSRKA